MGLGSLVTISLKEARETPDQRNASCCCKVLTLSPSERPGVKAKMLENGEDSHL